MDFMEKITELRAKKGQLLTQAQALVDEGKIEEANELTGQMEAINTSIAGLEALAKASQEGAKPAYDGALHSGKPKDEGKGEDKPFASLGEQLQAVYNFRKNHVRIGASRGSTTRCWASTRAAAPMEALPSRPISPG